MLKSNLRSKTLKSFTWRPKIRNQNFKVDPPGYLPVARGGLLTGTKGYTVFDEQPDLQVKKRNLASRCQTKGKTNLNNFSNFACFPDQFLFDPKTEA